MARQRMSAPAATEAPKQAVPTPLESVPGLAASSIDEEPGRNKPSLTPLKAIRANCLDCCAGQRKEVRECHLTDCPLWEYRMGRNPRRAGIGKKPLLNAPFPTPDEVGG